MLIFRLRAQFLILVHTVLLDKNCQEAFNKRLPVAVLDLSGTLWPLLIPEHSGIKRRGTPFLGLRNPGISHYSDKYPLPSYEKVIICNSLFDRDHLMFCKSGILIFVFAENNHLVKQYICPRHVDYNIFAPSELWFLCLFFFLFFLSLSLSLSLYISV